MECTLCNKKYVGKSETAFNTRLNNYKKDAKDPNALLALDSSNNKVTVSTTMLNL